MPVPDHMRFAHEFRNVKMGLQSEFRMLVPCITKVRLLAAATVRM
jgi:hypothetical protein